MHIKNSISFNKSCIRYILLCNNEHFCTIIGYLRYNQSMNEEIYHFNKAFITNPICFEKQKLFQIGDLVCGENFVMSKHQQFCFELTYVVEGKFSVYTNNQKFTLQSKQIHIALPDEEHEIVFESKNRGRYLFLGFDLLPNHPLYNSFLELKGKDIKRVFDDVGGIIYTRILECLSEFVESNEYSILLIENYLNDITIKTLRQICKGKNVNYHIIDKDMLISNIIYYIENHCFEINHIKDLCNKFSYSESFLSHLFQKEFNKSIYQYITDTKLKKAREELKKGTSVTEVALMFNYSSIYSFSRSYKKRYGYSPHLETKIA